MNSEQILVLILSIGFIVLIVLVVIALGTMIKILLDVRKVTDRVRQEADAIGDTIDAVSTKARSIVTNSLIVDKIVPAIMGAISVGLGAHEVKKKSKRKERDEEANTDTEIFTEEE